MKTAAFKHQRACVTKLSALKVGAIFMDMGTGKTRTYTELSMGKVDSGRASRVVILTPVSGRLHLAEEIAKHSDATVAVHEGQYSADAATINIIGTESMSSSVRAVNKLAELSRDAVVVADESHQIKNKDADRTRHIMRATALSRYRYLSTGTPMSNGIEDLWSQCQWLSPLVLGYRSYSEFQRMHLAHAMDWCGQHGQGRIVARFNTELIANRLGAYSFEARKSDCLDLPEKSYAYRSAPLGDQLSEIYAEAKTAILRGKSAFDADDATIFRLFTALQMLSNGIMPEWLAKKMKIDPAINLVNPKLSLLMESVDAVPATSKAVVWCKYLEEADQAAAALECAGNSVARMDGRMSEQDRHAAMKYFREEARYMVATAAAGGQVLDMSFADYGIYLSNSFDWRVRAQSEDRLHRAGMTGSAHYIDLRSECGIERRIGRSLERKESAAKAFMNHVRQLRAASNRDAAQEAVDSL